MTRTRCSTSTVPRRRTTRFRSSSGCTAAAGWGGSKEELAAYLRLVARDGYAVVAPRYSLAPERRYPTPVLQVMEALRYVGSGAGHHGLDPERVVLAGDSAGA